MPSGKAGALGSRYDLALGFAPVDLNTSDGATGLRVHLKNYESVTFVVIKAAGTAGEDPTFDVVQHTASTGGTTSDLDVVTKYYVKSEATLDNDEIWSKVSQSAASEVVDPGGAGTSAESQQLVVIEVHADQLSDGYEWVSLNAAVTAAAAQLCSALYILNAPSYQRAPELIPQPLA
jgi:hypothetical protein